MLESTQRTSAPGTLNAQRATAASRTNRSSLQSFASRFSAAGCSAVGGSLDGESAEGSASAALFTAAGNNPSGIFREF